MTTILYPDHSPRVNNCIPQGATVEIPLTQGKVALIDAADLPLVSDFKWYAMKSRNTYYAVSNIGRPDGSRTLLCMHRVILGAASGKVVDHKDGNGLNNVRDNIRECTSGENNQNMRKHHGTSQYKGVYWFKRAQRWKTCIKHNGKNIYLGQFTVERDAAMAYDKAALSLFGEFARPNFA